MYHIWHDVALTEKRQTLLPLLCRFADVSSDSDEQGLELLVQNLSRLDESNEEDAKGVNTTMGVLENLLEVGHN